MKKFLFKVGILFFITGTIMLGSNFLYENIRYRAHSVYSEEKFSYVPYNIQISNFGSSHGVYGIDYTDYTNRYTAFNFALTSQTLSYDYLILQQYEDHLSENGIMLILISNFSFGADEESQPDFESKNERYYSFLLPDYIKQFDLKQYVKLNYFHLFFTKPSEIIGNIKKGSKKGKDTYQLGGSDFNYQEDADAAYKRHIHVDGDDNIIINPKEINALYAMIEICKKHNIRPILITTPYRSEYNDKFSDKFYKQFHDIVNEVCKNTGAEYYDYSHDIRFIQSNEYERNADHLTPAGAIVFTDILINEVIKQNNR